MTFRLEPLRIMTLNQELQTRLDPRDVRDAVNYLDPDLLLFTGEELEPSSYDLERLTLRPDRERERDCRGRRLIVTRPENIPDHSPDDEDQLVFLLQSSNPLTSLPDPLVQSSAEIPSNTAYLSLENPAGRHVPRRTSRSDLYLGGLDCPREDEKLYAPLTVVEPSGKTYLEERLGPHRLGIQAIKGIGRSRGQTLRSAGYHTRNRLRETQPETLLELEGIGPHYASIAHGGAHAHEENVPLWFDENPVADEPIAYVDIETDAGASVIWQVGVYDEPTDTYHYFIETHRKNDPRSVPRSFARWVYEEAPDRTFLAWYGSGFDYPHLTKFIDRFGEDQHATCWNQARKVDLLQDIVRARTAVPSRSHKVDVVAGRLGYDRAHGGLSGADAARTYRQWVNGIEPDWERWIEYCRDDVLGMKRILDRLRDAPKLFDKQTLEQQYYS